MLRGEKQIMRVLTLELEKIGPFDEARLEFVSDPESEEAPVALITGENGAGKSILLDAIRGAFGEQFCTLERPIWRPGVAFRIELEMRDAGQPIKVMLNAAVADGNDFRVHEQPLQLSNDLENLPGKLANGQVVPGFVADFWRTTHATDTYDIKSFTHQNHQNYLRGALQGTLRNAAVTELICYFDYLRDSREPREKAAGEVLAEKIAKIIKASLLDDGEFSHVARSTFTPMIKQSGQLVPLANLSSGNAYLIQHMISMLAKMYAVNVLRNEAPEKLCTTPGLLLIDEAENHLHPRWQKRFLRNIREVFPNLQIIATTHSPFILASAPGARVFVCRYDRDKECCVVSEESDSYASKPVDEILISEAFDGTQPFSEEMTKLIEGRKSAIERGDTAERRHIEDALKAKNPDYFSYFDIDEHLAALGGAR
jgi:predicted ATP-binding protein involved in virulence